MKRKIELWVCDVLIGLLFVGSWLTVSIKDLFKKR